MDAPFPFSPFDLRFTTKMLRDIPCPYPLDYISVIFNWCDKKKIETSSPKDRQGLYTILIVHIKTWEQCLLFQGRFIKPLSALAQRLEQATTGKP